MYSTCRYFLETNARVKMKRQNSQSIMMWFGSLFPDDGIISEKNVSR